MTRLAIMLTGDHLWRRLPWAALAVAGSCGGSLVVWAAARTPSPGELAVSLQVAAVLLAAGAASGLDDDAEPLTATTPFGRPRRRLLGLTATAAVVFVGWLVILLVASTLAGESVGFGGDLPALALLVQLGALCAGGWAIAAAVIHWRGSLRPGARAGAGIVVLAALSAAEPRLRVLWSPFSSGSSARWLLVGLGAIAVLTRLSGDGAGGRRHAGGTA